MAISPVRIISIKTNGRTMLSNASIFSVVPVTSTTIERLVTSTTLPRKISVICISSPRWGPSAETLNRASSRETVSDGSRSRIFSTLISLCNCLVTWSIGCSAPSTVSVTREMRSSSVGPTVSVSMLKPLRANRPAMRVRTPDLFSTRIDSTCLRPVRRLPAACSSSRLRGSLVAGSPISAHHLSGGLSRGGHRVGVLPPRLPPVHDHRPLRGDRSLHVVHQRRFVLQAHARRAVRLRELHPVGVFARVHVAVAAVPEQLLPLAHHAQIAVVHDEHLDRDLLLRARCQLLGVHLHRAVAGDAAHQVLGAGHGRAHRGGQAEAHRAQAPRVDPAPRRGEVVVLRRPHLVLADVADDDRLAARRLVQRLDHVLRLDLRVDAVLIGQRGLLTPAFDPLPPPPP